MERLLQKCCQRLSTLFCFGWMLYLLDQKVCLDRQVFAMKSHYDIDTTLIALGSQIVLPQTGVGT